MAGDETMQVPKPKIGPFEFNLNTAMHVVTLFVMVAGGVTVWANTRRDIDDLLTWQAAHEALHKERLAEVKGIEAAYNERLKSGEAKVNDLDRKMDNLTYRVTVAEQSAVNVTTAIKELQTGQVQQAADIKFIKEILQRIEAAQKNERR